jgi:hypothetical protein
MANPEEGQEQEQLNLSSLAEEMGLSLLEVVALQKSLSGRPKTYLDGGDSDNESRHQSGCGSCQSSDNDMDDDNETVLSSYSSFSSSSHLDSSSYLDYESADSNCSSKSSVGSAKKRKSRSTFDPAFIVSLSAVEVKALSRQMRGGENKDKILFSTAHLRRKRSPPMFSHQGASIAEEHFANSDDEQDDDIAFDDARDGFSDSHPSLSGSLASCLSSMDQQGPESKAGEVVELWTSHTNSGGYRYYRNCTTGDIVWARPEVRARSIYTSIPVKSLNLDTVCCSISVCPLGVLGVASHPLLSLPGA